MGPPIRWPPLPTPSSPPPSAINSMQAGFRGLSPANRTRCRLRLSNGQTATVGLLVMVLFGVREGLNEQRQAESPEHQTNSFRGAASRPKRPSTTPPPRPALPAD